MFDLYGNERLICWKKFRNHLEDSPAALEECIRWWSKAPFVSPYLNPLDSKSWPDPWHLVLDAKFDNLAIILGMLYTLQLTDRFKHDQFKIYMRHEDHDMPYVLSVGEKCVVDLYNVEIENENTLPTLDCRLIFATKS